MNVNIYTCVFGTWCRIVSTATHLISLQHAATHCITLQHAATHFITLQHAATLYNTLHHTPDCTPEALSCCAPARSRCITATTPAFLSTITVHTSTDKKKNLNYVYCIFSHDKARSHEYKTQNGYQNGN